MKLILKKPTKGLQKSFNDTELYELAKSVIGPHATLQKWYVEGIDRRVRLVVLYGIDGLATTRETKYLLEVA